jgi:hypothetical protein
VKEEGFLESTERERGASLISQGFIPLSICAMSREVGEGDKVV